VLDLLDLFNFLDLPDLLDWSRRRRLARCGSIGLCLRPAVALLVAHRILLIIDSACGGGVVCGLSLRLWFVVVACGGIGVVGGNV
jgi:hypothetical protein